MASNARFWGKRRYAGFLVILAISVSLIGLSVVMFAHFTHPPRKEPKVNVALAPTQTSTIAPISGTTPTVNPTLSPSSTVIATSTASPISTTTPTASSTPLPSNATTPMASPTAPPRSTVVGSPLLYGTNLVLADANDPILTSSVNQSLLEQIHIQIIRMPIRTGVPEAVNVQAAQMIKNMGAVPDIILFSTQSAQSQANNILVITDMNRIFGNTRVYYEFGNEDDLKGITPAAYTTAWDASIPMLKQKALNGWFIGPVTYHYDAAYLAYFVSHAKPFPDSVSWHEYGCRPNDTIAFCMAHLATWTAQFQNAYNIISTTGKALPIMITEWNYDAIATPNDGKNNNSTFMHDWTMAALQTLAANHIYASMQYSCTDPLMPLVTPGGTLTAQGNAFSDSYKQLVLDH